MQFSAQDNVKLGNGSTAFAQYAYSLKKGYPGIILSSYALAGSYSSESFSGGDIEQLLLSGSPNSVVMPEDFITVGVAIQVGVEEQNQYSRI